MAKIKAPVGPELFSPAWCRQQIGRYIQDAQEGLYELEQQGERISFLDCCDDMVGDGISDIMDQYAPKLKYGCPEYAEKFNALAQEADNRAGFGGKLLKRLKMSVKK